MFCDLVGSTALSAQLDPEELREVIRAYQASSAAVIERYEGHIAQHLGDGLLVYFGYPVAHEDDAVRAVRAGLEIIQTLPTQGPSLLAEKGQGKGSGATRFLDTPHPSPLPQEARALQVRIGIHTGLVVVDEVGGGTKREQLALGETPNIAARLQNQAAPNEILVSTATLRLLHGLFETEDLGRQELKGISTPLVLYRLVGESAMQGRAEPGSPVGLTPLVGRELEMNMLRDRWQRAVQGAGQVVLLGGEPGIGKSRVVRTFREQVVRDGAIHVELRCSPYHQHSAYYPIIEQLQRVLGFTAQDPLQVKLDKLTHTLASYRFPRTETLSLLAAFLSLPHPEDVPPLVMSPQRQKEKTHEAILAWMVEEAERAPVYCVWEDLHWADPSTLELITLLLAQVPRVRVLIVVTFRPEFTPPWGPRSYLSQLTLSRLGQPQVETMVGNVTGGHALAQEILQQIVAKTDGVPLFVEELTKSVLESLGVMRAVESPNRTPLQFAIPTTLHDALMARLDRLNMAKDIAQLGAVVGREFSYELLRTVSALDEESLQQGLQRLVETELVYQRGVPPQATYVFKHALVQDTAYQSLLKSTRQHYHQQIAQVLEKRFPELIETQPELLAHHYTEGGLIAQALRYWQQAGERAIARSTHTESIAHLTQGLELLKTLPDTPERAQYELSFQITLGRSLMATKGYAAPDVEYTHARALDLCRQVGNTPQLFVALAGLFSFYLLRAQLQTVRELVQRLLMLAQDTQNPTLLLGAYSSLAVVSLAQGELPRAYAHLKQAIALYDPQKRRAHTFRALVEPRVNCRCWAALTLWYLGYPDQALRSCHEALTLAQELSHPFSLTEARDFAAWLHQLRGEAQQTQEQSEAAVALAVEHGFPQPGAQASILRGWALAMQGQGEAGIAQLRQGMTAWRATGAELCRSYHLALLAEVYGKEGQTEEGLHALAEAFAAVNTNREHLWEAALYRLQGDLLLAQEGKSGKGKGESEKSAQAEACFLKAIEIARQQQAKSLELRATMSLAQLWQQQGKREEARQILAEVYGWFTEGFDTKDLQEAQAWLARRDEKQGT